MRSTGLDGPGFDGCLFLGCELTAQQAGALTVHGAMVDPRRCRPPVQPAPVAAVHRRRAVRGVRPGRPRRLAGHVRRPRVPPLGRQRRERTGVDRRDASPSGSTTTRSPTPSTRRSPAAGRSRSWAVTTSSDATRATRRSPASRGRSHARGFLMVSGGGPGAMEATHLGVWMAHFDDDRARRGDRRAGATARRRARGQGVHRRRLAPPRLRRPRPLARRRRCATSRSASPPGPTGTSRRRRSRRRSRSTSPTASARTACSRSPRTAWCSPRARPARSRRSSRTRPRTTTRCSARPHRWCCSASTTGPSATPCGRCLQALSADRPYDALITLTDDEDEVITRIVRAAAARAADRLTIASASTITGIDAERDQPADQSAGHPDRRTSRTGRRTGSPRRTAARRSRRRGDRRLARQRQRPCRQGRAAAREGVGLLGEHDGEERRARRRRAAWTRRDAVARSPAGRPPAREERGHRQQRLGRAEHAERTERDLTIEQPARCGRAIEGVERRRLGAERGGGQRVGAEVEGEDLQHPEREREPAAGDRPQQERRELGDVVGEVVREELAGVEERRPAQPHRLDDGGEVVVEQHQVGRLAGHVGARATHRDADVGLLQRRAVVHAVAGHRDDVAARLQRPRRSGACAPGRPG